MKPSPKSDQSWYRTWFNSPYYHLLYRNRDEEEAKRFIHNLLKYLAPNKRSHFLDLACGKGRHSLTVSRAGFEVTGADLAEENIRFAKKRSTEQLHFVQHDMREPLGESVFDYVLNLFTSFGYFESLEENERVLAAIAQELKPKGKVVLDFMNVEKVTQGLVPLEQMEIDGVNFKITRTNEDGFIVKTIEIEDGDREYTFHERVKALTKEDFMGMFHRTGFEILDTFGNYNLDDFDPEESSRLILIARKP
ncbi:MAG TPA: methyltransferase domain-containing protein [Cryomorphaceae bacterium]|nr:methyltransferase domain-containing protein [Cryomorphaceae bacterium]